MYFWYICRLAFCVGKKVIVVESQRWEFIKENKKVKNKHAFDQENDQEKKKKENTLSTKKAIKKKKRSGKRKENTLLLSCRLL